MDVKFFMRTKETAEKILEAKKIIGSAWGVLLGLAVRVLVCVYVYVLA